MKGRVIDKAGDLPRIVGGTKPGSRSTLQVFRRGNYRDLTVTVADCIPVYLAVPGRGVALLHAGWRGTAHGILARGVAALRSLRQVDPATLLR